jgi:ABC-2 type transport system permease protein
MAAISGAPDLPDITSPTPQPPRSATHSRGRLPARTGHRARLRGLRSLPGFAVRRSTGSVVAWATGIWLYFLVIGLLASSLTVFLADNPLFADLAAQAGFGSLTTVAGYLASLFALLAIPLGLFAAGRVAAGDADEEARRLTGVFAAPVTRRRWLLVETGAAVGGTVVVAAGAGFAAWTGAAAVGGDVLPAAALSGALNVLPVAWLSLGAALLAYGWLPQATLLVGAVPAVGGFLLLVLAESLRWPGWVLGLSPYRHVQAVPYESELGRHHRHDADRRRARRDRGDRLPATRPPQLTPRPLRMTPSPVRRRSLSLRPDPARRPRCGS